LTQNSIIIVVLYRKVSLTPESKLLSFGISSTCDLTVAKLNNSYQQGTFITETLSHQLFVITRNLSEPIKYC